MKKIRVIILKVGSDQFEIVEDFNPSLENMQKVVDGLIQAITLKEVNEKGREITIWLNDEGKLNGMLPNFAIMDKERNLLDIIMGDVLITATNEMGETDGLTDGEILIVNEYFDMNFGLLSPVFVNKTLFINY